MKKSFRILIFILFVLFIMPLLINKVNASSNYDSTKVYTLECDVDDPYTLEEIIDVIGLEAYDNLDNLSGGITCYNSSEYINKVLNVPNVNGRELGTYDVNFRVSDSHGNVAYCTIRVEVKDKTAPRILIDYCTDRITMEMTEIKNATTIENRVLEGVKAIDTHDMFDVDYVIETTPSVTVGEQNVRVFVYDQSRNSNYYDVKVTITDDVLPRFTITTNYFIDTVEDAPTALEIISLASIKAYASNGTSLTVTVKDTGNPSSFTTPGIYVITYEARDGQKVSTLDFYLEVLDTDAPTFKLNENVLVVTSDVVCSSDKINSLIKMKASSNDFTYEVLNDNYTDNYNTEGDYDYKVLVTYDDGRKEEMSLTLRVVEEQKVEETKEELEETFIQKALKIIKKVSRILFGIIKWPYLLLKTLF